MKKKSLLLFIGVFLFTPFINVNAKTAAQYIIDLSKTDTVNIATDDPDHNPRYIGSNPDNYVEFNGETWRIIGVIDGKVKLIRSGYLESGNPAFSWDTSARAVNSGSGVNYWSQADIMTELNTDYLNSDLANDVYWYSGSGNAKNAVFDHTKVIKADAKEMIADAVWHLGSPNYDGTTLYTDASQISAETLYTNERLGTPAVLDPGTSSSNDGYIDRDKTWTGKVALIYPSDFLYSTSGNAATSREICLASGGWNTNCANTSWLKDSRLIWTISAATTSQRNFYVFQFSSAISNAGLVSWPSNAQIRPSIHLKDNVIITDGDGSEGNKFKLGLANTITFNSNGGSDVDTQYVGANEKVTEPTIPTKEDSTFQGWYMEPEFTNKYNFNDDVNGNLDLYAKWQFNYKILEGADQTFGENDIVIKTNGSLNKLVSVKDNEDVIPTDKYSLKSGSTIFTLGVDYLNTMSAGTHTISFIYNDGSVSTSLTVPSKEENTVTKQTEQVSNNTNNPKTSDNVYIYISLCAISIIGLLFIKTNLKATKN